MILENKALPDNCLVIGDLHFGRFSSDTRELAESVEYFEKFIFPRITLLNEKLNGNLFILQAGDVFDNKSNINTVVHNKVIDIFLKLSEKNIVVTLVGNHDSLMNDKAINSVRSIGLMQNSIIITVPTEVCTKSGEKIVFNPNYSNKELLFNSVSESDEGSYFFGHDEINGFMYEGKLINDEKKNLSQQTFRKFKRVIFGHIHKRQEKENILFCGSAYHTRINEHKNECGIHLVSFNDNQVRYFENKYSPTYKIVNLFDVMEMKANELEIFKNKKITVLCGGDSIMRIKTYKFTELLEKLSVDFVKIDYKPLFGGAENNGEETLFDGENEETYENNDLVSEINEFIEKTDSVIINKNIVQLNEKIKQKSKDFLLKLYKKCETSINLNQD